MEIVGLLLRQVVIILNTKAIIQNDLNQLPNAVEVILPGEILTSRPFSHVFP